MSSVNFVDIIVFAIVCIVVVVVANLISLHVSLTAICCKLTSINTLVRFYGNSLWTASAYRRLWLKGL